MRLRKSPLFWRFSGGFWFSQDRLFSRNSTRKPLNLIKSPIFTNAPCKTPFLYNAPSMHTVDTPPQIKVSHLSLDPPRRRQGAKEGGGVPAGWWRVSRHFWVPKTDRATGGCRSYSHTSRATLCNQEATLLRSSRDFSGDSTRSQCCNCNFNYFWARPKLELQSHWARSNLVLTPRSGRKLVY